MEAGQPPTSLPREAAVGAGQEAQQGSQQQDQLQAPAAAVGSAAAVEGGPSQRRPRVLLAATGSVATIKLAQLAQLLLQARSALPAACWLPGVLRCISVNLQLGTGGWMRCTCSLFAAAAAGRLLHSMLLTPAPLCPGVHFPRRSLRMSR